jgi:hypothetical protein
MILTRIAATLSMVALSLVALTAPANAVDNQVVHTKVNVSLTNIVQCGFTVNSVIRGTNTFKVSFDESGNASFQSESLIVSTLTSVANGKVVHVDSAGRDAFSDAGVVNPDGTITFTDTLTGRDLRIYTSHSNVLLRDAGFLSIVDTVDSEGNFLSEQLIEHGQHQFAGDFNAMCDAIASAIG